MSNPASSKIRTRPKVSQISDAVEGAGARPLPVASQQLNVQPVGLFSTPGRAIALIGSIILLLVVFGSIALIMGQRKTGGTVATNIDTSNLPTAPRVNSIAPDFTLTDVKTNLPVKLSALRGKPVWINFWGTWCPPCRAEMPEMQKIYDRVKSDVVLLGISIGPKDEPKGVAQFVDLNSYTWQFIHDADTSVEINYQVTGIPSSFFIDTSGVIRHIQVGGADGPTLEAALATIYKQ